MMLRCHRGGGLASAAPASNSALPGTARSAGSATADGDPADAVYQDAHGQAGGATERARDRDLAQPREVRAVLVDH
jgi:hypothetical protein